MKKHLLLLAVAALSFGLNTAKAQVIIPNLPPAYNNPDGFEVWHSDPVNGSAKDPNNGSSTPAQWQCLNPLSGFVLGSSPVSVFQDSVPAEVHGGKYSCKIVSVKLTATSYSYVSAFLPHDTVGMVMTGSITGTPSFKLGAPFNKRIATFSFWYLYSPQTGAGKPDTASCSVVLTHYYNGTTNILGSGELLMNAAGSWTQGTVTINYDSLSGNPDTIDVVFNSSSYFKPVPGSTLIIDDATVPVGINEVHATTASVDVYPNPASDEVNFRISGKNAYTVEVYDITGKKISTYGVTNNMASVNTSNYNPGLYLYQVYDKTGTMLKVGKFSVVR